MMSTPDILAENLLSDEEHNTVDRNVIIVAKFIEVKSMEEPDHLDELIPLIVAALSTAPTKAYLYGLG